MCIRDRYEVAVVLHLGAYPEQVVVDVHDVNGEVLRDERYVPPGKLHHHVPVRRYHPARGHVAVFYRQDRLEVSHTLVQKKVLHVGVDLLGQVLSLIHISEPTRLGMISYAVFCLKKKKEYKIEGKSLGRIRRNTSKKRTAERKT